jgi:hypothetical protein
VERSRKSRAVAWIMLTILGGICPRSLDLDRTPGTSKVCFGSGLYFIMNKRLH